MKWINGYLFCFIFSMAFILLGPLEDLFSMQNQMAETIQARLDRANQRIDYIRNGAEASLLLSNQAVGLAHASNATSINAYERSTESLNQSGRAIEQSTRAVAALGEIQDLHAQVVQHAQNATANLDREFNRLREVFEQDAARNELARREQAQRQAELNREEAVRIAREKIIEKQRLGVFEQAERIKAEAAIDVEQAKWKEVKKIVSSSKVITKTVVALAVLMIGFFGAKYGLQILANYFTRPKMISETSKGSWFDWRISVECQKLEDLVFAPDLHKQLLDLTLRINTAKKFGDHLPNVLFFGPSGTGKTAFAKALAYTSGLDYALTSGSEFAKITDLDRASEELRNLLNWAKKSRHGMIVFIDEAESLFAHRNLPTSSKLTQDFINTFLSLISDQSQKDVMFIFATNYPFKLDDAIIDRIGESVEFMLPGQEEQIKILELYLEKFAQKQGKHLPDLHSVVIQFFEKHPNCLQGLSARAIKFIAQEAILLARQYDDHELADIFSPLLKTIRRSTAQNIVWQKKRSEWIQSISTSVA